MCQLDYSNRTKEIEQMVVNQAMEYDYYIESRNKTRSVATKKTIYRRRRIVAFALFVIYFIGFRKLNNLLINGSHPRIVEQVEEIVDIDYGKVRTDKDVVISSVNPYTSDELIAARERTKRYYEAKYLGLDDNEELVGTKGITASYNNHADNNRVYGSLNSSTKKMVAGIPVVDNITPVAGNSMGDLQIYGRAITTKGDSINILANSKGENFLNLDLRTKSGLESYQIEKVVQGTGLEGLGRYYLEAEEKYNVNALYLLGLTILESDWGTSNFARTRNNLTGFMAYTETPESAKSFQYKDDSIMTTAAYLDKHYLTEGAKYYNGRSMLGVNIRYCTSQLWSIKINNIMLKIFDDMILGEA